MAKTENVPTKLIAQALAEDLGSGDCTAAAVVPKDTVADAVITQKAAGVIFGLDLVCEVFWQCDQQIRITQRCSEGKWRDPNADTKRCGVLHLHGDARAILAAERTALNFLGHLSGIATQTAWVVREVAGTGVTILDTRKTTPGLRALEKAAVRAGGGTNHRMGLYDAILIKENHIMLAGGIQQAITAARAAYPQLAVEIECETEEQVDIAVRYGADRILLDNMQPEQLQTLVRHFADKVIFEASGGITQENVRAIAQTGVEYISIGALTHSAPSLDLSLTVIP